MGGGQRLRLYAAARGDGSFKAGGAVVETDTADQFRGEDRSAALAGAVPGGGVTEAGGETTCLEISVEVCAKIVTK